MTIAAIFALVIIFFFVLFQAALALGAPLGRFAWGGQYKTLPKNLRISSAASILIFTIFAVFIASKASIWEIISNQTILNVGLWAIFAYLVVGVIMNGISRSKPERYTMTPVALALAICFFIVANS